MNSRSMLLSNSERIWMCGMVDWNCRGFVQRNRFEMGKDWRSTVISFGSSLLLGRLGLGLLVDLLVVGIHLLPSPFFVDPHPSTVFRSGLTPFLEEFIPLLFYLDLIGVFAFVHDVELNVDAVHGELVEAHGSRRRRHVGPLRVEHVLKDGALRRGRPRRRHRRGSWRRRSCGCRSRKVILAP